MRYSNVVFFFFNDTATTEIYTLSLHDALPIWFRVDIERIAQQTGYPLLPVFIAQQPAPDQPARPPFPVATDRKSTRLNSSHANISYAVFCLKKKKKIIHTTPAYQYYTFATNIL